MVKPRLLITRFQPHAQRLSEQLTAHGVYNIAQPLLAVQAVEHNHHPFIKHYDFIIAVSANAVRYTQQSLKGADWPESVYLAVGEATQQLLKECCGQAVKIPNSRFNSEGLLALPELNSPLNCSVLILRGVSGREFLKDQLSARGARIDYFESYRRVKLSFSRSASVDKWQQEAINGVIISSIELLERLVEITESQHDDWLKALTVYSDSQRILNHAQHFGFYKTALLPSIVDQDIIDYFTDEGSYE